MNSREKQLKLEKRKFHVFCARTHTHSQFSDLCQCVLSRIVLILLVFGDQNTLRVITTRLPFRPTPSLTQTRPEKYQIPLSCN